MDRLARLARAAVGAGDAPVRPRSPEEDSARRSLLMTGRAFLAMVAVAFADPDLSRASPPKQRVVLGSLAGLSAIHSLQLVRLYRIYGRARRSDRVLPMVGVAHGLTGYACLPVMAEGIRRRSEPLVRVAAWYTYLGMWIDLLDGALRRRRALPPYFPLAGVLAIGGVVRHRRARARRAY